MNRFTLVAAAVAAGLVLAGCSDGPVTPGSNGTRPQLSTTQGGDLSVIARYTTGPIYYGFAFKTIGTAGGTIKIAGFEVNVPAGAVSKNTTFSIVLPYDSQRREHVWAEFGPHNVQFAVPVTIKLPFKGTTAESTNPTHVLWNNGGTWVAYTTSLTADGRLQTQTNHFSEYGTEETNRGITLSGGKPYR